MSEATSTRLNEAELSLAGSSRWRKVPFIAFALGALGLALWYGLGRNAPQRMLFSYLVAFLFWLSIAVGALFFVLVHYASRGTWGTVVRRLAENAIATLPLFALLFVPIALGIRSVYPWSNPEALAAEPAMLAKHSYLNPWFFYARALLYFAIWGGVGWHFFRQSVLQDRTGDRQTTDRLRVQSGVALVLFALTTTFAAFDWVMSLEPMWYSTVFGVYFFSGAAVAGFAFLPLVAMGLRRGGYLGRVITIEHYHDLGKLLFAFTLFWTYIAFSQYMLYWYGNVPEEVVWYRQRQMGSWRAAGILLAVGHFALPFLYLMTRKTKRSLAGLALAAAWLLAMHYVDLYWQIMPVVSPHGVTFSLLDLCAFVGVGGLFFGLYSSQLRRHALVPIRDPRLGDSIAFENY